MEFKTIEAKDFTFESVKNSGVALIGYRTELSKFKKSRELFKVIAVFPTGVKVVLAAYWLESSANALITLLGLLLLQGRKDVMPMVALGNETFDEALKSLSDGIDKMESEKTSEADAIKAKAIDPNLSEEEIMKMADSLFNKTTTTTTT